MRHTRLTALTFAVGLATAACSGASSPAPATPPVVAPSAQASAAPSAATPSAAAPSVPASAPPAGAGSAVSIAGFSFQPATITVAVGATVTWTNQDSAGHTVTADDSSFTSERLATGATFSHTFATAGTFTYHCAIHSSMKATVTVQ